MDFLKSWEAFRKQGISIEEFKKMWELDMKLKQQKEESRTQELKLDCWKHEQQIQALNKEKSGMKEDLDKKLQEYFNCHFEVLSKHIVNSSESLESSLKVFFMKELDVLKHDLERKCVGRAVPDKCESLISDSNSLQHSSQNPAHNYSESTTYHSSENLSPHYSDNLPPHSSEAKEFVSASQQNLIDNKFHQTDKQYYNHTAENHEPSLYLPQHNQYLEYQQQFQEQQQYQHLQHQFPDPLNYPECHVLQNLQFLDPLNDPECHDFQKLQFLDPLCEPEYYDLQQQQQFQEFLNNPQQQFPENQLQQHHELQPKNILYEKHQQEKQHPKNKNGPQPAMQLLTTESELHEEKICIQDKPKPSFAAIASELQGGKILPFPANARSKNIENETSLPGTGLYADAISQSFKNPDLFQTKGTILSSFSGSMHNISSDKKLTATSCTKDSLFVFKILDCDKWVSSCEKYITPTTTTKNHNVRVQVWFDSGKKLRVCLLVSSGEARNKTEQPLILASDGYIYNPKSKKYTNIWKFQSKEIQSQSQQSSFEATVCLSTKRGSYPKITYDSLLARGYCELGYLKFKWNFDASDPLRN